jgi:hypothetical protein
MLTMDIKSEWLSAQSRKSKRKTKVSGLVALGCTRGKFVVRVTTFLWKLTPLWAITRRLVNNKNQRFGTSVCPIIGVDGTNTSPETLVLNINHKPGNRP